MKDGKANMSKDERFVLSVFFNLVLLSIALNYYEEYKKQQKRNGNTIQR
jgi:hypothetical protein